MLLVICAITICILSVGSVSYAFFTTQIIGNEDAEAMVINAGTMEITFSDSNQVNVTNFIPGDYVTKKFTVENTGNLPTRYNIRLDVSNNTFVDRGDLEVSLAKDGVDIPTSKIILPASGETNGYILVDKDIYDRDDTEHQNDYKHEYTLTFKFKKDEENPDQNDNAGSDKQASFKIVVDTLQDQSLYTYTAPTPPPGPTP